MEKLEKKIQKNLDKLKARFKDNEQMHEFEKITQEFEKLVKAGLAKKRGNNLLSTTDAKIKSQFSYNSK